MSVSSQSTLGASRDRSPLSMVCGSTEEHLSTNPLSPSLASQDDNVSAGEFTFHLLDRTQETSEYLRYQTASDFHPSHTPHLQPLNETTDPAWREDGRDESIPLRSLGERDRDQETQRPLSPKDEQKSPNIEAHRARELSLFQVWWLEIAACVLILSMLAAIVGTLYPHQGQPIPHWPYNLSEVANAHQTNTLIAFYVVVLKIALVSVISAGLGQLKWSWFHETRPLHNLGQYDEATRGPWGSFLILWTTFKAKAALPAIGACIMILVTILEPMAQQVLRFYPCVFNDQNGIAAIPIINYAAVGLGTHLAGGVSALVVGAQSAINAGVYDTVSKDVSPTCVTGNCTFPDNYASAGWCSSCTDVSDQLQRTPTNGSTTRNYTLPSTNLSLGLEQRVNFVLEPKSLYSLDFQAIFGLQPYEVYNDTDWTRRGYGAAQCTFYPCVRRHSASVKFGVFSESLIAPPAKIPSSPDELTASLWRSLIDIHCLNPQEKASLRQGGYEIGDNETWLNYNLSLYAPQAYDSSSGSINATITNIHPECIYQSYNDLSLGQFLSKLLSGSAQESYGISGTSSVIETIFNEGYISFESIDAVFSRMAQSLTVWGRQYYNGTFNWEVDRRMVAGQLYRNETCIRAQWLWLIYPAVLVLGTIVFLSWTMVDTRGHDGSRQDYKAALLPLMFVGVDGLDAERRSQPGFEKLAEVEKRAKAIDVRLENAENGWKFVVVGRA